MAQRAWLFALVTGLCLTAPSLSWAQDPAAPAAEPGAAPAPEAAPPQETPASATPSETEAMVAEAEKGGSPIEEPGRTYYFVGARFRYIVVPKFMLNLFADGGKTEGVIAGGGEFAVRKDAFEHNFGLWLADYSQGQTLYKGKDDDEDAWEIVESKVKVLFFTADFLWSHDFSPEFALNYGMGAGFGIVFGALKRNQAYLAANGEYEKCVAPGNPTGAYCGDDNKHYGDYEEPSWAGGGSKPILFPWFALQTGFRYKAHRNFVMRFDTGFGLSGFFLGVGADYGL